MRRAALALLLVVGIVVPIVAAASVSTADSSISPAASYDSPAVASVSPAASSEAAKPNIVLILTDDQRYDDAGVMTTVQTELAAKGVKFNSGMVVNPWCCPSRASILTGKYSHGTDVYRNFSPHGGFGSFKSPKDQSTIATWLKAAGYRTGLIGKYLNGYNSTYKPPGWDEWIAFCCDTANEGGAYYNYSLIRGGAKRTYGSAPADYSTDVLSSDAQAFIRATPAGQPLFLYFSPFAPHGDPVPAERHKTALSGYQFFHPPSWNEADVSDKPAYIRALPLNSPQKLQGYDASRRKALRTLLAVDEAVKGILDTLDQTGRLSNTMVVFMSDNGLSRAEHRWTKKQAPYEEDIRVPLVVRYDPLTASPRVDDTHLALNIDLAPTFAAVAGVSAPGADGNSLIPLLTSSSAPWRSDFLVEHLKGGGGDSVPSYCAVRSGTHTYVQYQTGEEELYDLVADPYQLQNRSADPAFASVKASLRVRAKTLCQPTPPGFVFPY